MTSAAIQEQEKELFDFWENIPITIMLDEDQYDTIRDKPGKTNLRYYIISIMAEGIEDTYPETEERRYRHALSAAEIKDKLDDMLEEKITSSNVYFHLQKLEEAGLIYIVGSLPTGRRFTAYYGRVARAFMLETDESFPIIHNMDKEEDDKIIDDVFKIIKKRNPDLSEEEIDELRSKVLRLNQHRLENTKEYFKGFEEWIEDHDKLLKELDVNVIELYMIFQDLINYKKEFVDTFIKFQQLLGVEEYSPDIE